MACESDDLAFGCLGAFVVNIIIGVVIITTANSVEKKVDALTQRLSTIESDVAQVKSSTSGIASIDSTLQGVAADVARPERE